MHPPHPSRSSLAVARSLSERCKEDKLIEGSFSDVPITSDVKSYSDQIDAVMEQLNANCDFSLDLLLADPASNVANKTSDGKGKKKHDPYGLPVQPGLTKKSNSASQLSVSGKISLLCFPRNVYHLSSFVLFSYFDLYAFEKVIQFNETNLWFEFVVRFYVCLCADVCVSLFNCLILFCHKFLP